jgi:glycosyltransferase involved in cell wall biosynthesis
MKIIIASTGRFHLLDLARELEKHGNDVKFYTCLPKKRVLKFGLKEKNCISFFVPMIPFIVLLKVTKYSYWSIYLQNLVMDFIVSTFMEPCDFFIALGSVYKKSLAKAKIKYNAKVILEWGSKHIVEERKQIETSPNIKVYPQYFLKRDLAEYQIVDYIAIPSEHARYSFLNQGIHENKLLINPYGVDLEMFSNTSLEVNEIFDVIMVGQWCIRKGCDLLIEYFKINNHLKFLHVGPIVDIDFPNVENMTHQPPVDQSELVKFYSRAKTFILPSRTDGFGLVLSQALGCGLPIVCSKNTGGSDLKNLLEDKKWIIIMEELTVNELDRCIKEALILADTQIGLRNYAKKSINNLTWEAYGTRYSNNLTSIFS